MIKSIVLTIASLNWIIGMFLMLFSQASGVISKTNFERTGWKKYRMGYSIREIKKAMEMTEDEEIKKKLSAKITQRKIACWLMISTPILIVIGNL